VPGVARPGTAWRAWQGSARQGMAGVARRGKAWLGLAWQGMAGMARQGGAGQGRARPGAARHGGHGTVLTKAPTRQPTKKDNRWPNT